MPPSNRKSANRTPPPQASSSQTSSMPAAPSPTPSPVTFPPKKHGFFYRNRMVLPNTLTLGNALCGVFATYFATQRNFPLASFLIVLGFIFDAFDGPVARYLKCSGEFGMFMDSLADVTCFGTAPTIVLIEYFDGPQQFIGIFLGVVHFTCTIVRLAKFMTEDGPPGRFSGMPCPFAGVLNAAVCAAELPPTTIIALSLIHSFYMINWGANYIKPFSVSSKFALAFVWFLHFLALALASLFNELGNQLLALIPIIYGTIPVLYQLYCFLFNDAKYPGQSDYALTVGVYDMFHRGHLELFTHMGAMAKHIYAAVHDEESVYQNKKVKVTDSLETRMNNVSQLEKVERVFPVYTADPSAVIEQMIADIPAGKSAIYMRGDDWQDFPGKHVLEEHNIPIIYHHYTEGVSSSLLRLARKNHTL
ncbi:putative CDP-diacylglycerol--serine O-phosphatidyltransferase [Blattamonas nauphoetae]|uniref:CDP-diacylglycerol--serine O-phosphatidyltransferase n=1 Tax=Blattamonas nauphoetae TaxID=2049346 RepID=A0ABQ9X2P0_9EUKA|nr:putative CDP-diacylglycerol--serine O-phosphatidyltransferase [Blattamonas nauphoetae]